MSEPGSHVERLTVLSKNVQDAINEIFSMAYIQAHSSSPLLPPDSGPEIKLIEKSLWINRIMIPLASRQKTLTFNLTKLLSRTRTYLEEFLAHAHQPFPLDWLVFELKTRKYRLYKIRTDYLKPH